MQAGITAGIAKDGREIYVLVVKGTFDIPLDESAPQLSAEQAELVYADEYYGEPAVTSIRQACDFALAKPKTDVVLVGSAHSPGGVPTQALRVTMQVGNVIEKTIRVVGNRKWEMSLLSGLRATEPEPFQSMPLTYERAFGGSDTTHRNPRRHGFHYENLVGVGLHTNTDTAQAIDKPLPNLEDTRRPIASWGDTTPTMGFSFVSPNWKPRINHAGTYDDEWLENRFPFLPDDFDEMYFQTAPADQTVPYLKGGERVTLTNLSPHGELVFSLPVVDLPVTFLYRSREENEENHRPNLDTVILEPDRLRFQMIWRTVTQKTGKPDELQEVIIGPMSDKWWRRKRSWKPHYRSLAEYIQSRQ